MNGLLKHTNGQPPPVTSASLSASAAVALAQKLAATSLGGAANASTNGNGSANASFASDHFDDDDDTEHVAGDLFSGADNADAPGPISMKNHYLDPTPTQYAALKTHYSTLLDHNQNETIVELGLERDGSSMSFTPTEYTSALSTLTRVAKDLKADLTILHERSTALLETTPTSGTVEDITKLALNHSLPESTSPPPQDTPPTPPTHAHILLRRPPSGPEHLLDLRICVVGNVDAGKSTLLGVLTKSVLDDGRGKARVNLFRHKHEIESGRTSSVGMEIMGFDSKGNVVGGAKESDKKEVREKEEKGDVVGEKKQKIGWEEVVERSSKLLTFMDLAGHEKYLKTTVFGMTGCAPDYVMLMIAANNVITKIDMCPRNVLENTIKQITKILRSSGCRKVPVFVRGKGDVVWCAGRGGGERICPIFQISNVTGHGLPLLKLFLNILPPRHSSPLPTSPNSSSPVEYQITDTFSVPGVGTVVSGTVISGTVNVGDTLLLGPDSLGNFVSTMVKSIQRKRVGVNWVGAGVSASFALKKVKRSGVRKGMVLVSKAVLYKTSSSSSSADKATPQADNKVMEAAAVWEFDAEVVVLYHSTTIGA
ncbi:hypothetical protein HK097_003989, partial [Rhizophlyctis rosea]